MNPRIFLRRGVLLLAMVAMWSATVSADSWVYILLRNSSGPAMLFEVALTQAGLGAVQREATVPGVVYAGPVVSFDGRYVVFTVAPPSPIGQPPPHTTSLAVFDRRTGAASLVPGFTLGVSTKLFSDPRALRFFLIDFGSNGSLTIVEPMGVRTIAIGNILNAGSALSADGGELFVVRGTAAVNQIAVLDPLTGQYRRAAAEFPHTDTPTELTLSADGQRLWVTVNEVRPDDAAASLGQPQARILQSLRVLDARTGAELARRAFPDTGGTGAIGKVTLDESRNRAYVSDLIFSTRYTTGRLAVLDATTLNEIAQGAGVPNVLFDRAQRIALNVAYAMEFGYCVPASVVIETWADPSQPTSSIRPPSLGNACPHVVLATAPSAPTGLSRQVVGRRVTLTWSAVGGATEYRIEAGSATGLSDLAVVSNGGATTFSVDGVPSGTYYIRVRAIREIDVSSPSSEVVVVVP